MLLRDYRPDDLAAIQALHAASGLNYALPDLGSPLFLVKKVVEVEGKVVAAAALRIEAETYLWCGGGPRDKMDAMCALQPALLDEAWMRGLDNLVCWIPEAVEAKFEKRLKQLGWSRDRDGWHSWSRATASWPRENGAT